MGTQDVAFFSPLCRGSLDMFCIRKLNPLLQPQISTGSLFFFGFLGWDGVSRGHPAIEELTLVLTLGLHWTLYMLVQHK